MHKLTEKVIDYKRITATIAFIILVTGLMSYHQLPRAENPGFVVRKARITTLFPGASPERIEQLITDPLEEVIQEMPEVEFTTSESRTGVSVISVKIHEYFKEMRPIWDTLRRKVEKASRTLPSSVIGPIVNDEFGDVFGTILTISGQGFSFRDLKEVADEVRNKLLFLEEVAKVEIYGAQQERIFVEYQDSQLADLGGSTLQLKGLLDRRNILTPGGFIYTDQEQIVLEPSGNFETIEDLRNTVVNIPGNSDVLYIKDFTNITRGYIDPPTNKMRVSGAPCLGLAISLREGGNIIKLGEEVDTLIEQLKTNYPIGLNFSLVAFEPMEVDKKVSNFISNLMESIAIVMAAMLISLGMRTGLVVSSLIPMTILMTFAGMSFFSIGIDQTSLAALIIALGMLVDNAIVMSESILIEIKSGKSAKIAALSSVKELYIPLLTSSLTTSAAFLPIFFAKSSSGEYTSSLFKVVTIALLSSWILSLTLIPFLSILFLKSYHQKNAAFSKAKIPWYRNTLLYLLKRPYRTLGCFALAFLLALFSFSLIHKSFFPPTDRTVFTVDMELPVGTKFTYTEQKVEKLEKFIEENLFDQGVTSWATFIGGWAPRYILNYNPHPPQPEKAFFLINTTSEEVIPSLMEKLEEFTRTNLPQVRISPKNVEHGPPVESPVAIRIFGEDEEVLYALLAKAKNKVKTLAGVKNIRDDWGEQSKKIIVKIDQPKALRAGVSNQDVAISLQTKLSGFETTKFRESEDLIPVTLRSVLSDRQDINKLETLRINSQSSAASVPLKQIADINLIFQPNAILRRNRVRTMTLMADTLPGYTSADIVHSIEPWLAIESQSWPEGYTYEYGGKYESSKKATSSIREQLPIAALLVLLLLVMQFNSFRLPLIVLLTIPLGIIGVAVGLLLTGEDFSFMTLLGVVSLSGIVINNAIVLLDRIRFVQRTKSIPIREAILDSAERRLRPILLTTITTVGGLMPLWFSGGALFRPMAVAIIFGLLFATMLTLIFVPVIYSIFFNVSYTSNPDTVNPYLTPSQKERLETEKQELEKVGTPHD